MSPLLLTAALAAAPVWPGNVNTVNVIQWSPNQLPKIYERSQQLPLKDEELVKLSRGGFTAAQLVKMIEERRCACDASADGLIRLKQKGVAQEVLSAISLHALPPNRGLNLLLTLDFAGDGREAREGFLYFFVDDGDLTRAFTANLGDLLGRENPHETMVDKSDIMIARKVRRVQLSGEIPLKTYGKHTVLVATSANPTLTHPSQLAPGERARGKTYTFDYPRASLQSVCRLDVGYKRDAALAYKWNFTGSRFECEWE
jgi:hypothetical protein